MVHEKEKEIKSLHCYKDVLNLEVIGTPSPSYDSINIHVCLHMDVFLSLLDPNPDLDPFIAKQK
jgi:hypothetical protein